MNANILSVYICMLGETKINESESESESELCILDKLKKKLKCQK